MEVELTVKMIVVVPDEVKTLENLSIAPCEIKLLSNGEQVGSEATIKLITVTDVKKHLNYEFSVVDFRGDVCLSKTCPYNRECAQHDTAGDHRSEGGMQPRLKREGDKTLCQSINTPSVAEAGYYDTPIGHSGGGMLIWHNGQFISYDEYRDTLDAYDLEG